MDQALEAILFVAEEPVDAGTLARVLEADRDRVEAELRGLAHRCAREGRGVTVRRVAGGWRMYTAEAVAPQVERFVTEGRPSRLSQAALETLAVVAYKQPVSRQRVGDIRGVDPDAALRTLVGRGLVREVGRDPGPGRAVLYGTSQRFLEELGLDSLEDLPALSDFLPEAPAPDEPAPGRIEEARRRLAAGADLPATGGPAWEPEDGRDERHRDEREMAELSESLEEAARSAMDRLRAVAAGAERDGPAEPAEEE